MTIKERNANFEGMSYVRCDGISPSVARFLDEPGTPGDGCVLVKSTERIRKEPQERLYVEIFPVGGDMKAVFSRADGSDYMA